MQAMQWRWRRRASPRQRRCSSPSRRAPRSAR
jgi:hypothetical protein